MRRSSINLAVLALLAAPGCATMTAQSEPETRTELHELETGQCQARGFSPAGELVRETTTAPWSCT